MKKKKEKLITKKQIMHIRYIKNMKKDKKITLLK